MILIKSYPSEQIEVIHEGEEQFLLDYLAKMISDNMKDNRFTVLYEEMNDPISSHKIRVVEVYFNKRFKYKLAILHVETLNSVMSYRKNKESYEAYQLNTFHKELKKLLDQNRIVLMPD